MDRRREIIDTINAMSGRRSGYEIFTDWIRCLAMAISNAVTPFHGKDWQDREQTYIDTMRNYTDKEREQFARLTACLVDTLEDDPYDVLGDVYMNAGMGSKMAGQFFTPFHLSVLSARISLQDSIASYRDEKTKLTLNEPTCGGGVMIIAAAKVLKDEGINYQKVMDVIAQDLDWKGVYMCYVQLSLLGIKAICVQGDTLSDPYVKGKTPRSRILVTPAKMGVLIC